MCGNRQYKMLCGQMSKMRANWIYLPENSITLTVPIFTEVLFADQHQVQTFCTEFHLNRPLNYGNNGKKFIYTIKRKVWVSMPPIFAKLALPWQLFVKRSYTEFHENLNTYLVSDARWVNAIRCRLMIAMQVLLERVGSTLMFFADCTQLALYTQTRVTR